MNKRDSARRMASLVANKYLSDHSHLSDQQLIQQLEHTGYELAREGSTTCAAWIFTAVASLEVAAAALL
jgi:hypothetical protein